MKLRLAGCLFVMTFLSGVMAGQQSQVSALATSASSPLPTGAAPAQQSPEKKTHAASPKHKIGPFEITINWRTRAEGWNWFQGKTGNSDYPSGIHCCGSGSVRPGNTLIGSPNWNSRPFSGFRTMRWLRLPRASSGLGGNYYVANNNQVNNASVFLKQAFVDFKHLGPTRLKLGRFEYFDGTEVKAKDPTLAAVVQTRISSRLISNFAFAAVQRTFDGGQFSLNGGRNNFTFFGARPTAGVFQVDGMPELDVEVYYGAFTRSINTSHGSAQLRVFGLGYVDDRNTILKTDNRPTPVRTADLGKIQLGYLRRGLRAGHQHHERRQVRFPGLGCYSRAVPGVL